MTISRKEGLYFFSGFSLQRREPASHLAVRQTHRWAGGSPWGGLYDHEKAETTEKERADTRPVFVMHQYSERKFMTEYDDYLTTGMLGAYHPENAVLRESGDGGVDTLYRDSKYTVDENYCTRERKMLIKGRRFVIFSVFPVNATSTPTDKMLSLIDMELEKESKAG